MPQFSARSNDTLDTAHPDLQRLFREVVRHFDCTVIEGHRSIEKQEDAFAAGRSKVRRGKHNETPALAVDVAPYPINWADTKRHYFFGGFVLGMASQMGIAIRWGGDWDRDTDVNDQTFFDLVHFELHRRESP